MVIGVLILEIQLPGCQSLKEKRGRLKPLLARLHREFNVSASEVDLNDSWQLSLIACSTVSNNRAHTTRSLQKIVTWMDVHWPDATIIDDRIELYG
ncbi:MAG: DUF503 domain-containing protein [Anaerolineales bacterium]|nr:DUF503 domain-containing protein [Anaerolineales bacterium]